MSEKMAIMPFADYEAACNSVRAKTGKTDTIKSGDLATEIDSIEVGGGGSDEVVIGIIERSLTEVVIPGGTKRMGSYVFYKNTNITKVTTPNSLTRIGQYSFNGCSKLESVSIAEGCEEILHYAFQDCKALESIVLPSTCNYLPQGAFYGCTGLKTVTFKCNKFPVLAPPANTFGGGCTAITDIYVPWAEGEVPYAPWGATNATIHYNSEV